MSVSAGHRKPEHRAYASHLSGAGFAGSQEGEQTSSPAVLPPWYAQRTLGRDKGLLPGTIAPNQWTSAPAVRRGERASLLLLMGPRDESLGRLCIGAKYSDASPRDMVRKEGQAPSALADSKASCVRGLHASSHAQPATWVHAPSTRAEGPHRVCIFPRSDTLLRPSLGQSRCCRRAKPPTLLCPDRCRNTRSGEAAAERCIASDVRRLTNLVL